MGSLGGVFAELDAHCCGDHGFKSQPNMSDLELFLPGTMNRGALRQAVGASLCAIVPRSDDEDQVQRFGPKYEWGRSSQRGTKKCRKETAVILAGSMPFEWQLISKQVWCHLMVAYRA